MQLHNSINVLKTWERKITKAYLPDVQNTVHITPKPSPATITQIINTHRLAIHALETLVVVRDDESVVVEMRK